MTYSTTVIRTTKDSEDLLKHIFNPDNAVACASYGGGVHCTAEKVSTKIKVWGPRGDNSLLGEECKLARVISIDSEPVAVFNIGVPGRTVIDITEGKNASVYEIGAFVVDEFLYNSNVSSAIRQVLARCKTEDNYTKTIATFAPTHPYLEELLKSAGGVVVTSDNVETLLGDNSLHPERFKFDETGTFYECSKWNTGSPVEHDGFNLSDQCINWILKKMVVLTHGDSHIFEAEL